MVSLAEFLAATQADDLRPLSFRTGTPAALPKELRPIWKQLKEPDVVSIDAGLAKLSDLVSADPVQADLLLTEVGVDVSDGSLILGNRFQRAATYANNDANEHLHYALLGVLSRSAPGSRGARLRQAVRQLEPSCPSLPELRGFESLVQLDLTENTGGSLAGRFGPLPALRTLRLRGSSSIRTLEGLEAPQLREIDVSCIGLTDLRALAGKACIQILNLSGNRKLTDLTPLQACLPTLKSLHLYGTGIANLSPLSGAGVLEELDLDDCNSITSLQGLENVTISGRQFSLGNLNGLSSLQHLQAGNLTLSSLKLLTTLEGLESRAAEIRSLTIWETPGLTDLSALAQLSSLEELELNTCKAFTGLKPLEGLTTLRSLALRECPKLKRLPDLSATSLEDLSLEDCGISDLGVLPASLSGSLDLVSLKKLKSLTGLERCSGLRQISIGHAIEDASALAACNEIAITVDLRHANGNAIPEPLIETLAGLPQVRLRVEDSQYNYYSGLSLDNPQALARIPHLRTLDLSGCSLEDLLFVVGLAELEELKIEPRSELSRKLGGCTFEGRGKVAKLQLQLLGMT